MSDFRDCPACSDLLEETGCADPACASCMGTGARPLDQASIELALSARDWVDERVSDLFSDWCRLMGVHAAYGVHRWETWGDKLRVIQDTSCRGCFDTETRELELCWLWMGPPEREAAITALRRTREAAEAAKAAAAREGRIGQLRAELARLERG
ncbi:hypothetical protein IQ03_03885 [Gemmobacter caeni]|uniref:Uncharacterized protein n=1 Tax=Gemmobacter caeni TaxID=589035 RepID=A0A2T6B9F5_9RHOB|nr:hypothetical protein [Gemmobacter caeni]PTX52658.1 hypothetical protein C8N34_102477 [Gemmobacter caeni]TWI94887.1 hypothetical protein IQ03_03885 [Gemmobacter caeni]